MNVDGNAEFMPPHLADLLEEELKERGWSEEDAALEMGMDYGHKLMAFEMFLATRDRHVVLRAQGDDFARAFGVQREFFDAVHARWVDWANAHETEYLAYKERRERELCES